MAICAEPGGRARGCAHAFLALSRASARRPVARSRHNSGRSLGKLFLGQILGLGSEGDLGVDRTSLLHPRAAWPAGGLVDAIRAGGCERGLFSRCINGVVRRELRAGQRSS